MNATRVVRDACFPGLLGARRHLEPGASPRRALVGREAIALWCDIGVLIDNNDRGPGLELTLEIVEERDGLLEAIEGLCRRGASRAPCR